MYQSSPSIGNKRSFFLTRDTCFDVPCRWIETLGLKALAALRHDEIEFENAGSDFCVYVTSWPQA